MTAAVGAPLWPGPENEAVPELSIVIPCFNEEENVRAIHAAVKAEAERHARSHEIIFIDNKSTDHTRALLRQICAEDGATRAIFNNRNYGQMRSPTHAIYQATGRAVIGMCADFQDPPAMIGEFMRLWRGGAEVVLGQRRSERASPLTRFIRAAGYGFLGRFADYPVIPGATGFGLFSRDVVDALATWNEPEPFFRGMVVEGGFRIAIVPFDRPERAAGETKNNLRALADFAISGIAGSSKSLLRWPIKGSIYAGLATALLLGGALAAHLADGPGWALLFLAAQAGMFAVLLLFLGLIGEQVRMISERTRNVPLVIEEARLNFPAGRRAPVDRRQFGTEEA
ncbi:glycosyltransferase family 2 protein [Edaphosphingomonas haloaromaticamans]|uniref:Putative glycosyltransferase CsbB n=1 Tax=Edaphosphingomonas haloaromaticamans TaxID=653954 RepID=A0A1S1H7U9_9SPHN|nr:glycosyltransferase family 2 protein [Sphingomonas haloaromaticamans]OHT18208.1 putative glycosyltransferase CsbB [Sphingomonas haloaromaticamans]